MVMFILNGIIVLLTAIVSGVVTAYGILCETNEEEGERNDD